MPINSIGEDTPPKGDPAEETVNAFVFTGDGTTIAFSPYSVKLLMYLRLAGIRHTTNVADIQKAPKSKVPYIQHGENLVGDSQLIIRYLENTFNVKKSAAGAVEKLGLSHAFVPYDQLSPTQKAKADMIRLTCDSDLYWAGISTRWGGAYGMCGDENHWTITVEKLFGDIPALIRPVLVRFIRGSVLRDAYGQGFCRHSPADQKYLVKRALSALSVMLGSGPYFLGKAPSECDCVVYGTIEQYLADYIWSSELGPYVREECPNLVEYCERIKSTVFADVQVGQKLPDGINFE